MRELLPKPKDCFCCGSENVRGLNISYYFKDNKVYAEFTPDKVFLISLGYLHPAVVFGVLFEAMSWVISYILKHSMVGADFNVRAFKPAFTGNKLCIIAEVISTSTWVSDVQAIMKDEKGDICFKANGKFTPSKINDEHIQMLLKGV